VDGHCIIDIDISDQAKHDRVMSERASQIDVIQGAQEVYQDCMVGRSPRDGVAFVGNHYHLQTIDFTISYMFWQEILAGSRLR